MDWQSAFNVAVAMVGGLGGWILRMTWDAQKELRQDLRVLEQSLPETYARRDDFTAFRHELFTKLDRIEEKIDDKADKQ